MLNRIKNKIIKHKMKATLIEKGEDRNLYKTYYDNYFWLKVDHKAYIDRCLRQFSMFEKESTEVVKNLIKQGDIVLDVGANIGYYSVIMSKIIRDKGKVLCFEPTQYYRRLLEANIVANKLTNLEIYDFSLSDKKQQMGISIGFSSATLHDPKGTIINKHREAIELRTLDVYIGELNIDRIDFIKIDVDGHEPAFLNGARNTIDKYSPIILLEISHLYYLEANVFAWDFYDGLVEQGFYIYSEKGIDEFNDRCEFLKECGNSAYSANIIISKNKLS